MSPEQQRESDAFTIWKRHGEKAPHFVAERIRDLAMADDIPGLKHWQEISSALDVLMLGGRE